MKAFIFNGMENRKLLNDELDRLNPEDFKKTRKTPLVIVLDNVRSLNNVGSVFRTADCYLIEEIILCGITAQPPHRDIRKTALGATETVAWSYYENTVEVVKQLQEKGYQVYAIEQAERSQSLYHLQIEQDQKVAVVFGNEVEGVQQQVVNECDGVVELEQYGTKHSLNISVCAGIVIYDLFHKINAHKMA